MNAIELHGLTKRYGDQTVVDDLSIDVEAGTIFGFLGPNGSGKTTTIKMLCTLVRPSSGNARINGHDVAREGDAVRQSIGYMAQAFGLYGDLTVAENLEFYARAYGLSGERRRNRIAAVIELVGIGAFLHRRGEHLSGGWQRRLALACALMHEPPVIFLDEPTAGIDPVARRELWDLIFSQAQHGTTFFVTTHYMDEAERCGKIGYILDGSLIAYGSVKELRALRELHPPHQRRLTIASDDVMKCFSALRSLPEAKEATIFGREVHALVDERLSIDELQRILRERGIHVEEVRVIEPSLEDVFVTLTNADKAS